MTVVIAKDMPVPRNGNGSGISEPKTGQARWNIPPKTEPVMITPIIDSIRWKMALTPNNVLLSALLNPSKTESHLEVITDAIRQGADVNATNKAGSTIDMGNGKRVKLPGTPAIFLAIMMGDFEAFKLLWSNPKLDKTVTNKEPVTGKLGINIEETPLACAQRLYTKYGAMEGDENLFGQLIGYKLIIDFLVSEQQP
ncbi:MAG: hypothetical protein AABX38_05350 [Candidatus Micrarchaeota archaeon]